MYSVFTFGFRIFSIDSNGVYPSLHLIVSPVVDVHTYLDVPHPRSEKRGFIPFRFYHPAFVISLQGFTGDKKKFETNSQKREISYYVEIVRTVYARCTVFADLRN